MDNSIFYTCQGTCSKAIEVETDGDRIERVQFHGGCNGNTKGIQQLVRGMKIDDVIERLEGTTCGNKPTSCPDQLCKALRQLKAKQATAHFYATGAKSLAIGAALLAMSTLTSCRESFEERCQREAREHTEKYCPQVVDLYQTLDSMTYSQQPQGFTYHYSMSGLMDNDSIYQDENALFEIKQTMLEGLKTSIPMRQYMERDMTFTYHYVSATTGQKYTTIVLTPEDYH